MTTLSINRKPEGIYGKPQETQQATPQRDNVTTAHEVMPGNQKTPQKAAALPTGQKMTKRQRKNHRRMMRLSEIWPALFNRESPKPLKVGILDDLMQDIAARGLAFGAGALRAAVTSYTHCPRYYRALMAGGDRYDQSGRLCGVVTPEEQKDAETRLILLKTRMREACRKGKRA